jgi:hypothetical protein
MSQQVLVCKRTEHWFEFSSCNGMMLLQNERKKLNGTKKNQTNKLLISVTLAIYQPQICHNLHKHIGDLTTIVFNTGSPAPEV